MDIPDRPRRDATRPLSPPKPPCPRGLGRNILWLGGGNILVKPIWLLFVVAACPRVLGVEGYGVMQTALALAGLSLAFADAGLSNLTLREVASHPAGGGAYLTNLSLVRGGISLLCGVGGLLAAVLLGYEGPLLIAVGAASLFIVSQQTVSFLRVFFRAQEDLRHEGVSVVVEKALVIGVGGAFLLVTQSAAWTLFGMALGVGAVAVAEAVWVTRRVARFSRDALSGAFARTALWLALPLGAADLLTVLYLRADQVMIEAMVGVTAAGQYGQAYRLLEALSLLPAVVVQGALFPRLSRLVASGEEGGFRRDAVRTGTVLTLGALGVAAILWAVAPPLIRFLTGDPAFDPASSALRVLVWTFPLTCIKDVFFVVFTVWRRSRVPIYIYGASLALNVGLNLIVIPRHGIAGAAATTVACESLAVVLYGVAIRTVLRPRPPAA